MPTVTGYITGMKEKQTVLRYQVHDEDGPVRAFYTAKEAKNYMLTRPELKLVVLAKPEQPSIFDGPPAVF